MADEEGVRVATAYVALVIDDEGLQEQIETALTDAAEGAGEQAGAVLQEQLGEHVTEGAQQGGESLVETLTAAGEEGGAAAAEAITGRLGSGATQAAEQISTTLTEGLESAGESAGGAFSGSFAEQVAAQVPEQMRAVGAEAGAALDEGLQAAVAGEDIGAELAAQIGYELETGLRAAGAATAADYLEQGLLEGFSTDSAGFMQEISDALTSGIIDPNELFGSEDDVINTILQRQTEQAEEGGQSSGEAFVQAFDERVAAGIGEFGSLADNAVLMSSFGSLGEQAGAEFAVQYSAQVEQALNKAELAAGFEAAEGGAGAAVAGGESAYTQATSAAAATAKASSSEGGSLGGLMGGPAGMLLWQLPYLLTMLPSLFGSSTPNPALAAITTAIQQAGGNTTTTATSSVQSAINGNGALSALESQTGLSATTLIEAAIGNPQAQAALSTGYGQAQSQDQQGAGYTQPAYPGRGVAQPNAQQVNLQQLQAADAAYNQIAASVSNAANAQAQLNEQTTILNDTTTVLNANLKEDYSQMALTAQQSATSTTAYLNLAGGQDAENAQLVKVATSYNVAQQQATAYASALDAMNNTQNATTGALNNDTEYMAIFNKVMADGVQAMDLSAQHSAQSSVAALQLGSAQGQLNFALTQSETAYNEAAAGASAYGTLLTSVNGTTTNLLNAQAGFTIALNNVTTSEQQYGTSLDGTTLKGAENIQTMTGISTAAQQQAVALYQSEVGTVGATKAYQDANTLLQQEEQAFVNAAVQAGYNQQQVQALANQLYQLPPAIQAASGTVNVNTSNAQANVAALATQLSAVSNQIDSLAGSGSGQIARAGSPRAYASGGPVQGGVPVIVGDGGRAEMYVPPGDGYIYPSVDEGMNAIGARSGPGGAVTFNYYGPHLPDGVQQAEMMRDLATVGAIG